MRKLIGSVTTSLLVFGVAVTHIFAQGASLSFAPNSVAVVVGKPFSVEVVVNTAGAESAGTGAKFSYDPQKLKITDIKAGSIYGDFPVIAHDNQLGLAHVSGIVNNPNIRFAGEGVLATVTFLPITPGSSTVSFVYIPNSTTDSNIAVTTGTGDILNGVQSLSVVATGDQALSEDEIQTYTQESSNSEPPTLPDNSQNISSWSKLINWLNPNNLFLSTPESTETKTIAEDGGNPNLSAKHSLTQTQPEATVILEQASGSPLLLVFFFLVTAILIVAVVVLLRKFKRLNSRPTDLPPTPPQSPIENYPTQPTQSDHPDQVSSAQNPQPYSTTQPQQPTQPPLPSNDSSQKPPPHAAHFR